MNIERLLRLYLIRMLTVFVVLWAGELRAEEVLFQAHITEGLSEWMGEEQEGLLRRRYVWQYQGRTYTVLVAVRIEDYNRYTIRPRDDIAALIQEGMVALSPLIQEIRRVADQRGWGRSERAAWVMALVRGLPYTQDKATTGYDEFRRYAVETLVAGGGDCEDTTILAGALLRGLGEDVVLLFFPTHVALGIAGEFSGVYVSFEGERYYMAETTGTGWVIGEMPEGTPGDKVRVRPLEGEMRDVRLRQKDRVETTSTAQSSSPSQRRRVGGLWFILIVLGVAFWVMLKWWRQGPEPPIQPEEPEPLEGPRPPRRRSPPI